MLLGCYSDKHEDCMNIVQSILICLQEDIKNSGDVLATPHQRYVNNVHLLATPIQLKQRDIHKQCRKFIYLPHTIKSMLNVRSKQKPVLKLQKERLDEGKSYKCMCYFFLLTQTKLCMPTERRNTIPTARNVTRSGGASPKLEIQQR